jgi:hypothetical protein
MRAEAREHARQIEAVTWLSVHELAQRWRVSPNTVRKIPRSALPYLMLGETRVRRFDPRDVEAFEQRAKTGESV